MNDQEIISTVKAAVALHHETKANLIDRMRNLLDPVEGVITIAGHKLRYGTVYAQCSQWGDCSHARIGSKKDWIIDNEVTLGARDCSFFDGHNHQHQFGPRYTDESCEEKIMPATAKLLREIARELPAALLAYAAAKKESAAANTEAAQVLS